MVVYILVHRYIIYLYQYSKINKNTYTPCAIEWISRIEGFDGIIYDPTTSKHILEIPQTGFSIVGTSFNNVYKPNKLDFERNEILHRYYIIHTRCSLFFRDFLRKYLKTNKLFFVKYVIKGFYLNICWCTNDPNAHSM